MNNTNKIDMVYLWCDGNDPKFRERKDMYMKQFDVTSKTAGEQRFSDNDELKYSLRSLEKYASWINHVYIVTDRQTPKWLNTKCEKVTVVDHSEIMPQEIIPVFNSVIIEYFLPYIPHLSKKFLYGNDDLFFGNVVTPEDFFCGDKPIVRLRKSSSVKYKNDVITKSIRVAMDLLKKTYNRTGAYRMHHNIDAYSKDAYLDTLARYQDEFVATYGNRFRTEHDVHRIIFALDALWSDNAVLKLVKKPNIWERCIISWFKDIQWETFIGNGKEDTCQQILKYKPKLFCINDSGKMEERENSRRFLEALFPQPSKFEK